MSDYTIDQLAKTLGVTRRSIERCMKAGELVPTGYQKGTGTGHRGTHTFSQEYVEQLKCLAKEARSLGCKYVMGFITSTGTMRRRSRSREQSASAWAQKTQWKRNNATRRSSPEVTLASALDQLLG